MKSDTHKGVEPILSDFTPFNPFMPPVGDETHPSYKELFITFLLVMTVTVGFFTAVHLSGDRNATCYQFLSDHGTPARFVPGKHYEDGCSARPHARRNFGGRWPWCCRSSAGRPTGQSITPQRRSTCGRGRRIARRAFPFSLAPRYFRYNSSGFPTRSSVNPQLPQIQARSLPYTRSLKTRACGSPQTTTCRCPSEPRPGPALPRPG